MNSNHNSDTEKTFPITPKFGSDINALTNFEPMPKRFKVWDKEKGDWIFGGKILDIRDFVINFGRIPAIFDDLIIYQSTNNFDSDGKEIFEGSIVEASWSLHTGFAYIDNNLTGVVKNINGAWCIVIDNSDEEGELLCSFQPENLTLRGHILSSSELLDGRNVE